MIGAPDRKRAVRLIKEATNAGARTTSACREMGISLRTFQRWTQEGDVRTDGRPSADRPAPGNKLTRQERQTVLDTVNSPAYRSLPPSQIVPGRMRGFILPLSQRSTGYCGRKVSNSTGVAIGRQRTEY